jgi:Tautomerase enzyme
VHEHRRGNFVLQTSGLRIPRTDLTILVSVTTRPRSDASNLAFYKELCRNLEDCCVIESSDVIVTMVTNADVDCRFGNGRAQLKTGKLFRRLLRPMRRVSKPARDLLACQLSNWIVLAYLVSNTRTNQQNWNRRCA